MAMNMEQENITWFRLFRQLGPIKLAQKIAKLPSYRKYIQRYPFDGAEAPLSLDYILPNAQGEEGSTAAVDILPDPSESLEEQLIGAQFNSEFKSTLTKRQLRVLELLEAGYRPKDIYKQLGYKNTGGVRYVKWAIRQKYNKFKLEQDND
jgi:DNA-binding CsgD family transcriptional regulator